MSRLSFPAFGLFQRFRETATDAGEDYLVGGRLVTHARYYWLMLAEGHLTRGRFVAMLRRIARLPLPVS
jgi:hypothetical protein